MTDAKTAELVEQLRGFNLRGNLTWAQGTRLCGDAADLIQAQAKEIVELREALVPFSDAVDSLHDKHADRIEIWESPAAIDITAGDLRRARAVLSQEKSNGE